MSIIEINYLGKLSMKSWNGKMSKYFNFFKKNLNTNNFNKVKKILAILNDNDLRMTFKDRILSPKYDLYDQNKLKKKLYNIGFKILKELQ